MDQPDRVRRRQARGRLHPHPHDLADLERPIVVEPLLERPARDVVHHDEWQARRRGVDGVDGDDVLVGDRGHGPRLAGEPASGRGAGGQLGGQHLDRDEPAQGPFERPEDDAHPPPADDLGDLVTTESAELPGPVRRLEDSGRDAPHAGRLGADRGRRVGGEPPGLFPPSPLGRHPFQPEPARLAAFQVAGQLGLLGVREAILQEQAKA